MSAAVVSADGPGVLNPKRKAVHDQCADRKSCTRPKWQVRREVAWRNEDREH